MKKRRSNPYSKENPYAKLCLRCEQKEFYDPNRNVTIIREPSWLTVWISNWTFHTFEKCRRCGTRNA